MDIDSAIAAVRKGDHEAFAAVVELTERRLRAYLAFKAPSRELIDEVAHQAYITAYQKIDAYQLGTSFVGWLKSIALNHLRNECRRRSHGQSLDRLAHILAVDSEPTEGSDEVAALEKCLHGLGEDARRLLTLRYSESLSPAQIAERLGRIASSVRTALTRVRQSLLGCMERHA